jgi:hypothetical protein
MVSKQTLRGIERITERDVQVIVRRARSAINADLTPRNPEVDGDLDCGLFGWSRRGSVDDHVTVQDGRMKAFEPH